MISWKIGWVPERPGGNAWIRFGWIRPAGGGHDVAALGPAVAPAPRLARRLPLLVGALRRLCESAGVPAVGRRWSQSQWI